jgi:hypothetical protein
MGRSMNAPLGIEARMLRKRSWVAGEVGNRKAAPQPVVNARNEVSRSKADRGKIQHPGTSSEEVLLMTRHTRRRGTPARLAISAAAALVIVLDAMLGAARADSGLFGCSEAGGSPFSVAYVSDGMYKIAFYYCPATGYSNPGEHFGREYFAQLRWQESPGGATQAIEINTARQCNPTGYNTEQGRAEPCHFQYRFAGPPGSPFSVSYQSCRRGAFLEPSTCSGFRTEHGAIPLEMPPPPFTPPRLSRAEPETYMPRRFRVNEPVTDKRKAFPTSGGRFVTILVHFTGSLDAVPSPRFTNWGYRPTFRVTWAASTEGSGGNLAKRVRQEGTWTEATDLERVGDAIAFRLPEAALENTWCSTESSQVVCDPVRIRVAVFEDESFLTPLLPSRHGQERATFETAIQITTRYTLTDGSIPVAKTVPPPREPEIRTNRFGGDYASREVPTAEQCQSACASEARCKAWTWIKPGIQGPAAKCWLKSTVPAARSDDCCTSGVK